METVAQVVVILAVPKVEETVAMPVQKETLPHFTAAAEVEVAAWRVRTLPQVVGLAAQVTKASSISAYQYKGRTIL